MAVTIANYADVVIDFGCLGQMAAPAPFFKNIVSALFPRHESACLGLHFENRSGAKPQCLEHVLRNADFAVGLNDSAHNQSRVVLILNICNWNRLGRAADSSETIGPAERGQRCLTSKFE